MSDAEIAQVTQITIEHTAGRAPVVAADWQYGTAQAVAFASSARELGAAMVMVRPPDWQAGCTADTLVEHFAAVARELPVMVVTNLFGARTPQFGLDVVGQLCDRVPAWSR